MPKKTAPKKSDGRAGKDALMPEARKVAESGACTAWNHVLEVMRSAGTDTALLSIWATASDKDDIDRLCARNRTAHPKRRR